MLAEYGIIPDVFEPAAYSSREVCDIRLSKLKDVLLRQGLVRDFRDGGWRGYVTTHFERWDKRAKELVRKLIDQKRLVSSSAVLADNPTNDVEWCNEALASHRAEPLMGIMASSKTAARFEAEQIVNSIERLEGAAWWPANNESVHLARRTEDYLKQLALVLRHANSLMFIDPHIDPTRSNYAEFKQLLFAAKRPGACPARIEIHRVCYEGRGAQRRVLGREEWKGKFESLHSALSDAGLTGEVFIWDDFHDRFLVSDIIGILMGNGFDVSNNPNEKTTWARISRDDRVKIQREFARLNSPNHELHDQFTIGQCHP